MVYLQTTLLNVPGNDLNSSLKDFNLGLKVCKTSGELALCKRGVLNI